MPSSTFVSSAGVGSDSQLPGGQGHTNLLQESDVTASPPFRANFTGVRPGDDSSNSPLSKTYFCLSGHFLH